MNEEGNLSGRAQSAVRPLSEEDFKRIIELGMFEETEMLPRMDHAAGAGLAEQEVPFQFEQPRSRSAVFGSRLVRDRNFRQIVLRAYDSRCAVTGLKLINGGGRAEVQAAHIRPVDKNGPDLVTNGLALSGTAHWMFDRGLIGVGDDLEILVSRQVNDPEAIGALINETGCLIPPNRNADGPHPMFLDWHRENMFKQ